MSWQDVLKDEGFYFSPVFIEKIDTKKKKKLKKLLQKAQPTNMMGEDMTQLSDIIQELKEMDLVKSDKKLSKTVEGFDEKNLEILASASELRKDYETLFTQLRKMVYPDNKKKDGKWKLIELDHYTKEQELHDRLENSFETKN